MAAERVHQHHADSPADRISHLARLMDPEGLPAPEISGRPGRATTPGHRVTRTAIR